MKTNALTLVLNANARKPKHEAPTLEQLTKLLGPDSRVHITHDLGELEAVLSTWKPRPAGGPQGVSHETISFYGGDGSISCGLTLLIRHRGEDAPLPPVLAVRAGTINMLCSVLGFNESPDRTYVRWLAREFDTLRELPTLKIQVEGRAPHYGFLFSWGVGHRVLLDYYSRGPDPNVLDGMAVLAKTFFSACRPNAARTPLFKTHDLKLVVDGREAPLAPAYSLAAGTIDRLCLGLKPFAPEPILPGSFHVSANAMPVSSVALHAATLLYRVGDQRKLAQKADRGLFAATGARQLEAELSDGFTLDGELHVLDHPTRVRISAGPLVQFWTAHNRR